MRPEVYRLTAAGIHKLSQTMENPIPVSLGRAPTRRDWRLPNTRRGDLARLVLFLLASALLGHWQVSRPAGSMLVQEGAAAVAMPIISAMSATANAARNTAAVLPRVNQVAAENRRLKRELQELHSHNAALVEAALERERLRALLQLRTHSGHGSVSAVVIGRQLSQWPMTIILNRGRADGVRPRQPVIAAAGLVGRIYSTSAHSAVAIPLTDGNSSAGAMVQRSRSAGILEGEGDACRLSYLPLGADVKPGDAVVSSGLGGVFPKGVLIGTVESVRQDDTAATKSARVRLSADLARLEEVLVVCR